MKTPKPILHSTYLALVAACLCNLASGAADETTADQPNYSTNSEDRAACQSQLNRIYGAIQEYHRRNQKLPLWLSDLIPDYIQDPDVLVCPYVRKTGKSKKWKEQFNQVPVFGDPAFCTYAYEFCTQVIPQLFNITCRDYKERQMGLMGFGVPIVRCFAHRPVLNLAFDGNIYESPSEWEDNFVKSPTDAWLFHRVLPKKLSDESQNLDVLKLIKLRNPQTDARILDLSKRYNALLLHLSQMDSAGKLLVTYPEGLQEIDGIKFDIRGLIHLSGKNSAIAFPERVDKISVNRKCAKIHFLHGTMFGAQEGSVIASYVVHQGGAVTKIPIVYGKDVKTRWFDSRQRSELENPEVAWTSPPDRVGTAGKSLRLYHTVWRNPTPDAEVNSISFVSHLTDSAPFLVAITLE
jgi:hypothetical protein